MTVDEIIIDRIYCKLKKYGAIKCEYKFLVHVKLIDDVNFVVSSDGSNKIIVAVMAGCDGSVSGMISVIKKTFDYEPARPTFHPEEVIKNIIEMCKSLILLFKKFDKHSKLITKSCGLEPIHGRT